MATIKAPFNFVPLNDKVFFPDWADKISQDIPFEDGMSGTIELKITAKTPIFVRNGHVEKDKEQNPERYKSFSKTPDGSYFIPGTSIKGAVRSVLEILSFGKMSQHRVANQSFGIRDLSKSADGDFYRAKIKTDNVHCGWLELINDQYYLDDCGLPWRISVESIDHKFGCNLYGFIQKSENFKEDENRTAMKKYEIFGNHDIRQRFCPDEELRESKELKVGNRLFVKFDDEGDDGDIVFTGQPGERKLGKRVNKAGKRMMEGKLFEFVFPCKIVRRNIPLDESLVDAFISVHKNSPDYKNFRKGQLMDGEKIPVFFVYKEDGKTIDAIGLSYMFKYPAYNSIYNALPAEHLSESRDLSECIFGDISSEGALRGRVSFGNALSKEECQILDETKVILSSPNPSYYPLYLGDGQTWNSETIQIAGRKRYPTRNKLLQSPKGTGDMENQMVPLASGSVFHETIRFHNLKRVELGALLSSILFHNQKDCFHSIGAVKPLGYGKVFIEILNLQQNKIGELLSEFESLMSQHNSNWKNSPSLIELFAMAKGIPDGRESEFEYMHMDTNRDYNDFVKGKDAYARGEQLGSFSQIIDRNVPRASFIGNVQAAKERKNIEALLKSQKERREKASALLKEIWFEIEHGTLELARSKMDALKDFMVDYIELDKLSEAIRKKEKEIEEKRKSEVEKQMIQAQKEKAEGGLTKLLNEKYEFGPNEGNYKVTLFKVCAQKVSSWLKAASAAEVPIEQQSALFDTVKRLIANPDKKEKVNWNDFNNSAWQQISKFVGSDTASAWFHEITNK